MKLSTIFSKTGKGLQETSGKTSHLSRADRSVLMAIDGKLTVAELAKRVGKPSNLKFQQLVESLDNQGFIREVAPATSAVSTPRPPSVITPRPPASKPAGQSGGDDDLDFTQAFSLPKRPAAPSKPIDLAAKAHETAAPGGTPFDFRARAEAEAKAKAEADKKSKAEAEARAKAIAEAKAKAEAEAKAREGDQAKAWVREMAEAEAKAARDAIAKAEAEEARARKEAEDKKRREEEERKAKVEAERRAKEEAERQAKEEAERKRREEEERKAREEAERKAKVEAERRAKEEAERQAKEEAERKRREEEERKAREEAERKAKVEAERRAKEEAERQAKEEAERKRREEEERKAREEAERRRKEEEERKRREEEARQRKEEEERRRKEEKERKRLEAEERQRREAEERARREEEERRRKEEEERRRKEAEERKRLEAEERARREEEERRHRKEEERRQRRDEEDRRRAEEDKRRHQEDEEIRRREDEAREIEERPIREAEERQRREENLRRAEEDERRGAEDEAREVEDRKRREDEALRAKEEALQRKEEELQRKEQEIRRAEEERAGREEEARAKREREVEAKGVAKPSGDRFADRLLDDLDFLGKKDDEEAPAKREREAEAKAVAKPSAGSFLLDDLDFVGKKDDEKAPAKREREQEAEAKPVAKSSGGGFAERLLADLDLFGKKDEEEEKRKNEEARRAKEEASARKAREKDEKKRKEEAARRAKQEAKAREEADRQSKKEEERRAREEAQRNAQKDAERKVREDQERTAREKAERRAREKLERRRKAAAPEKPAKETDDVDVTDDDLGMDDVRRDEALLTPKAREAAREREREDRRRGKEVAAIAPPPTYRRPIKWGRPLAITLLVGLAAGLIAIHVVPIAQEPYERLASTTLGQSVRIGSAHMSLVNGLEIRFENVRVGDMFQAQVVRAAPEFTWLLGENTGFRRVDIGQGVLTQASLAQLLLGKLAEGGMRVQRISATELRLEGPVPLPALNAEVQLTSSGALRSGTLNGPDNLQVKLGRLGSDITIEARADRLPVPVLPAFILGDFSMNATASATGMNIAEWDGRLYDGVIKGNARVQWRDGWSVQGDMRIVEMNAGVFAPAMLSAGKVEANGRFVLAGPNPAKLGEGMRLEGKLAVSKGVLGSVDLSRAIQSGGRNVIGRTQFNDLSADAVYDRGAVALRNIVISAGALGGGGRVDISAAGRLGGRIVAEVKTPSQQLRLVLDLSGTAREPQASAGN